MSFQKIKPSDQQLKIDHINEKWKKTCKEAPGCNYSDHDELLGLAKLTTKDAMFVSDGYHLNWKGSQKLLDNLDLQNIAEVTGLLRGGEVLQILVST